MRRCAAVLGCDLCDDRAMYRLSDAQRRGLPAGVLLSVMASVLGGIYADSFVTGFALTAGICAVAIVAATLLLGLMGR